MRFSLELFLRDIVLDNVEKYKAVYKQYKTWKNDLTSRKILHARLEEIFLKLNYREKEILSLWTASEAVSEWDDWACTL